ncbi:MAG: tRNA adenosine(34) deaminase TadA [bacterium]
MDDIYFMKEALEEARLALEEGEVPVGAVVVKGGQIIARGHNRCEQLKDPTAHAEILAIREASRILNNHRLINTSLYVTLEPCPMCAGAIVWARIKELVYGAFDLKAGACGSIINLVQHPVLNHRVKIKEGILTKECACFLSNFFREKRGSQEVNFND